MFFLAWRVRHVRFVNNTAEESMAAGCYRSSPVLLERSVEIICLNRAEPLKPWCLLAR